MTKRSLDQGSRLAEPARPFESVKAELGRNGIGRHTIAKVQSLPIAPRRSGVLPPHPFVLRSIILGFWLFDIVPVVKFRIRKRRKIIGNAVILWGGEIVFGGDGIQVRNVLGHIRCPATAEVGHGQSSQSGLLNLIARASVL